MNLEISIGRSFLRSLVSHPAGRAHILSLMVAAEEGDEVGVFDQLIRKADDPELGKLVRRHKDDECRHAAMYRACLSRNGLELQQVPDELLIIRRVGREAGGIFAAGVDASSSPDGIATRDDVMETYALLLAIEERGVQRFPLIGAEFRRIGDYETADTFDRVTADERRHTRYCQAIGRRYAADDATWERAVAKYQRVEARAFKQVGRATLRYAVNHDLVWRGALGRLARLAIRARDALADAGQSRPGSAETYALTFASELEASMTSVWEAVGTMKGVNEELSPWLRMTAPPEARDLRVEDAPVGRPMFASWVLLGGVLPLDRHYFMLAQVEPGHGFEEDSTSWSQRRWEHRRHLEARGVGCVLTDRLTFTPRLRVSGPILERVIGAIFRHRHRLLRERFGGRAA